MVKVSEEQRQAMVAWKRVHGVRWREHLVGAFKDSEYPGIAERYAKALAGLHASGFGAKQLRHYTLERT